MRLPHLPAGPAAATMAAAAVAAGALMAARLWTPLAGWRIFLRTILAALRMGRMRTGCCSWARCSGGVESRRSGAGQRQRGGDGVAVCAALSNSHAC